MGQLMFAMHLFGWPLYNKKVQLQLAAANQDMAQRMCRGASSEGGEDVPKKSSGHISFGELEGKKVDAS